MVRIPRTAKALKSFTLALGAVAIVASAACSKQLPPPGELVIAVSTDMSIPKDLDTIRMQVLSTGVPVYDNSFAIFPGQDGVTIPVTLGVVAGTEPNARVVVRVIGIGGNKALILREATVQVPTDRTALLQLPLHWLSEGSASDPDPFDPMAPDPTADNIVEATCAANETEIEGTCESDAIEESLLQTYDPGLVFGGGETDGGGTCFDTLGCFPNAAAVALDMSDCTVAVPEGASVSTLNVAIVPADGAGICRPNEMTGCFVPLDDDPSDGWTVNNGRIELPPGLCVLIQNGLEATVALSTDCASKTPGMPTCGPWSAVGNGVAGGSGDGGAVADATLDSRRDGGSSESQDSALLVEDAGDACSALRACCSSLPSDEQAECNAIVEGVPFSLEAGGGTASCSAALATYRAEGLCGKADAADAATCVPEDIEGGACNAIANVGAPVTPVCASGPPPTMTGGTIADGTYIKTSETDYGCADAGGPNAPQAFTFVVSDGCVQAAQTSSGESSMNSPDASTSNTFLDGGLSTATYSLSVEGSQLILTGICPIAGTATGQALPQAFTATPTTITVETPAESGLVSITVLTKQ